MQAIKNKLLFDHLFKVPALHIIGLHSWDVYPQNPLHRLEAEQE